MIVKHLSKQQALDAEPKTMQQNNFTGNKIISFITKEAKETILDISQGTVKVLSIHSALM